VLQYPTENLPAKSDKEPTHFTTSKIIYLSEPSEVSMGDTYYYIADLNHFWIKHRFAIFRRMWNTLNYSKSKIKVADIGCGHGILQAQLGSSLGWIVDGYDLNHTALSSSMATNHPIHLYNIHDRVDHLKGSYDVICLFDVIEHIENEQEFLDSVKFHLKPDGILVLNVPAVPWLYSKYDRVQGHFRRYTLNSLKQTLQLSGFSQVLQSYWGITYVPLLLARKIMLILQTNMSSSKINEQGFRPPSQLVNSILSHMMDLDPMPNRYLGTSIMGIYHLG
jgi:2-polyprenyl-3-methyl-5-hydroxy-6-metoxy-1,4-benzoquinol methylase